MADQNKSLAIIALVLAIIFPLIGLIVGIIALNKIKKGEASGHGLAMAAVIIGVIGLVLPLLFVIAALTYFNVLSPIAILS